MLDEADENLLRRGAFARVAEHDRHMRVEVQCLLDFRGLVGRGPSKQLTATMNGVPRRSK